MNEPRNRESWENRPTPQQPRRCSEIPDLVNYFLSFVFLDPPQGLPSLAAFLPTFEGATPTPTQTSLTSRAHRGLPPGDVLHGDYRGSAVRPSCPGAHGWTRHLAGRAQKGRFTQDAQNLLPSKQDCLHTASPVLNLHCQGPNSSKRYSLPAPLHKQVSLGGHLQPQLSAPNVTSGHMKGLGS